MHWLIRFLTVLLNVLRIYHIGRAFYQVLYPNTSTNATRKDTSIVFVRLYSRVAMCSTTATIDPQHIYLFNLRYILLLVRRRLSAHLNALVFFNLHVD